MRPSYDPATVVKARAAFPKSLLLPWHWPTWLGLGIARLIVHLPYRWVLAAGSGLGTLIMFLSARRRHIANVNLGLCFPELGAEEHDRLLRRHFRSLGIGLLETGMAWWLPDERLTRLMKGVEGLSYLEDALEKGGGVILLSAHFTTTELGVRLLDLVAPVHPLYRIHENPVVNEILHRSFAARFERAIPRDDVRAMVGSLRRGKAVWYAPDQNYGHKGSAFAPFFGIPAATNTATSRFVRMTGAVVIPYFVQRLDRESGPAETGAGKAGYRLRFLPPLEDFPGGDDLMDARRINRVIEAGVREAPEQYLWVHRRFKDRPQGQRDVYDPSVTW